MDEPFVYLDIEPDEDRAICDKLYNNQSKYVDKSTNTLRTFCQIKPPDILIDKDDKSIDKDNKSIDKDYKLANPKYKSTCTPIDRNSMEDFYLLALK